MLSGSPAGPTGPMGSRKCYCMTIQLRYQQRLVHGIVLFFLLQSFAPRLARSLAKKTVFQGLL